MRNSEAYDLIRRNIGPGDIADKVNDLMEEEEKEEFNIELGDRLIDWIAEQITDEGG